jgi:hypothetical protein
MRRTFLFLSVLLTVILAALGVTINLHCAGAVPLAPPDPLMPITLADGSQLPLEELLARVRRDEPLPEAPRPEAPAVAPIDSLFETMEGERAPTPEELRIMHAAIRHDYRDVLLQEFGPVFLLAEEHRNKGNLDQAEALYLSIAEGEPAYGYARRRLAWDVLTKGRGQPERGVEYAHEALVEDPLNGNSWQDLARVYASTLGFEVD